VVETTAPDESNSNSNSNSSSNNNRVDVHDHAGAAVKMAMVLETKVTAPVTRARINWTKNWINTWPNQDPAIWMDCSIEVTIGGY